MANLNAWQKIDRVIEGLPFGNGSAGDGIISSDPNARTNATGSAGSPNLTMGSAILSDGDIFVIHQTRGSGVGQWEINRVASGGGGVNIVCEKNLQYSYGTCAQVIKFSMHNNVTVNSHSPSNWDGAKGGVEVICAKATLTIAGTFSASGKGYRGGNGNSNNYGNYGEHHDGNQGFSGNRNPVNCGGGGGKPNEPNSQNGASGGGGGHASAGGEGTEPPGVDDDHGGLGGAADHGASDLVSAMIFGGAGGGGGGKSSSPAVPGGQGGYGGGIVILIAKDIVVSGYVGAAGGAGSNGTTNNGGTSGGGGGGAGGSIILICRTADIGTNLIVATGGSGGGGNGGVGGTGGIGRIAIHYADSISGSTNPTSSNILDTSLEEILTGAAFLLSFY